MVITTNENKLFLVFLKKFYKKILKIIDYDWLVSSRKYCLMMDKVLYILIIPHDNTNAMSQTNKIQLSLRSFLFLGFY